MTVKEDSSDNEIFHQEMDDLCMKFLELSQDLVTRKLELEGWTKQGVLSMSQARNAMGGPHTVSQMQYPSGDISASVKSVSQESDGDAPLPGKINFTLVTAATDEKVAAASKDSGSEMRRRKNVENVNSDLIPGQSTPEKEETAKATGKKLEAEDSSGKPASSKSDPLKWFGFLVPNSLRQSQKCFQKAVEFSVDCANIQSEIDAVVARRKVLQLKE